MYTGRYCGFRVAVSEENFPSSHTVPLLLTLHPGCLLESRCAVIELKVDDGSSPGPYILGLLAGPSTGRLHVIRSCVGD